MMQSARRFIIYLLLFVAFLLPAAAQTSAPDSPPLGLAQQARSAKTRSMDSSNDSAQVATQEKSLAEMAREIQGKDIAKVKVSPEEAQKILKSVEPTLKFASEDSGLPIRAAVKPHMISRNDLVSSMQARKVDDAEAKRLQAEELTLKKFGYVPRVFSTNKFVEGMYAEAVAGFYDPRTKTISLLNWVAPDSQYSVLAHELTHALQDQNFNLLVWERPPVASNPKFQITQNATIAETDARRAVVEGQAMIVLIDHQFLEQGMPVRLELLPGASSAMSQYNSMMPIPDTPIIHSSPIFLRDALAFPYREGLVFELELLARGGKGLAFNRVFARPPLNTHEIMEPEAYLQREGVHAPIIPDVSSALADKYEVIDAGGLGELDIRSLIKQYDTSRLADTIARGWRGSSYLVVKRKDVPTEAATTADVGLIYLSAWNSSITARKFAQFYADTVAKRYAHAAPISDPCQGAQCPAEVFKFNTEEGFVSIEHRANNLVLVMESFNPELAGALSATILKGGAKNQTAMAMPDLSLRYAGSPIFTDLRAIWEKCFMMQALKMGMR